jgi:MoxR-like ATPase
MNTNARYQPFLPWKNLPPASADEYRPDDRSGSIYLEDEKLQFVTEVAIVTQRPLLLRGEPGSGKSSFAPFAARNLNWRYYEQTVTGRTEAKDMLWRFDALRRLRDARDPDRETDLSAEKYVTPGPLWWAFNRPEALRVAKLRPGFSKTDDTVSFEPFSTVNGKRDPLRAVVLIDEIDKADPNVPNDLLEVLGTNRFRVEEAELDVDRQFPKDNDKQHESLLTVITTNEERDLPPAFLRRCVVFTIGEPEDPAERLKRLEQIAALHMAPLIAARENEGAAMVKEVAAKCLQLRESAKKQQRRGPSIAEFLDAVRFCLACGLAPTDQQWEIVQKSVLLK